MRKKELFVCLILVVMVSLFGACAKPVPSTAPASKPQTTPVPAATPTLTPTPKPSPSPAPTPTPSLKTEPIELKINAWTGPTLAFSLAIDWYLSEVEKRTNGRIKIKRYWSDSLLPSKQILEGLGSGMTDMGMIRMAYFPAELPLGGIGDMYSYITPEFWVASKAYAELYQTMPALSGELAKYKARRLTTAGASPYFLLTKKAVVTLADLKGMKIRAVDFDAKALQAFGAVPVSMAAPEVTEAVQRGTIEGVALASSAMGSYGVYETAKYFYHLPVSGSLSMLAISDKAWNLIPKDIQEIMLKTAEEHHDAWYRIYVKEGDVVWEQKMKAAGVTFTEPNAADLATFKKLINETILTDWVKAKEKLGLPGQSVLDKFSSLVSKYEALNPYK